MTDNSNQYILDIPISNQNDAQERDHLLRSLWRELCDLNAIEAVEAAKGKAVPEGAKGDLEMAGLIITASVIALPQVLAYIDTWVKRQPIQVNITIVNTNGGAYVRGDVTTGNDFVGRDQQKS